MIPLIYIASPSYSGSTLLTFLLNAHPRIATVGELKWGAIDLATYACSCGDLLRTCRCWRQVGQCMAARGLSLDLQNPGTDFRCRTHRLSDRVARARVGGPAFEALRGGAVAVLPACRRTWPAARVINRALIECLLARRQATHFVDGSKDPVRLRHLLATGDYRVHLVELVRDGRGVVNSALKHGADTAVDAAREWRRTHEQIARLARQLGPRRTDRVRYEDLCADPPGWTRRVVAHAGLDPDALCPDYRRIEHHILGNQMRLDPGRPIRLDEQWRTQLGPADRAVFERLAGDANRGYGYA